MAVDLPINDKITLRAAMRKRRRGLAADDASAAERVAAILPDAVVGRFAVVGGYHALGAELDPAMVLERLAEGGAAIALPAAYPDAPLTFRLVRAGEAPEPDAFGVLSPPKSAPEVFPQLIIVPVLAFDRRGGRLGQGGGHYDRTIAALRARGEVFVLGLAYAGQEIAAAPREPHDQALDAILTENGYIEVRKDF
ncbi:MAG TPA: 5-formyltetrahydrofolate cyclo-ligase [Caulobacteraceae bacterium]